MMENFIAAVGALSGLLAFVGMVSFVVERLVEKLIKPIVAQFTNEKWADYIALVLGLVVSIGFNIDLLTPVAVSVGLQPMSPWFGLIVTGLGVGGGANFWHDIWPNQG